MPEFNYFAYLLFSLAVQFSPGPNNIMLSASGMNFGYRRTLPHIAGIVVGVPMITLMVGVSTEWVLRYFGDFQLYLVILAGGLLLWISLRIALMPPPNAEQNARPIHFWEALLFQIVNPKGWAMILSSIALFVNASEPERTAQLYVLVGILFMLCYISASTWVLGGMAIRRLLTKDVHFRIYNITCALILVACAVWVVVSENMTSV